MASDKVTIALMGVRGRGRTLALWFGALPDVRIPYVCDVDQNVVGPAMKMVAESQGKAPVLVSDIRRVLDDRSVDAIVMATPLHWHAPGTILACDAGKDVYMYLEGFALADSLKQLLPYTPFIHVKDSSGAPAKHDYLLPGGGTTGYAGYFRLLKQEGYRGFVVVEVTGMIHRKPGYETIPTAKAGVKRPPRGRV